MPTNNLQYTLSIKDLFSKKMAGAIASTGKLDSKMSGLNSQMSKLGTTIVGAFSVGAVVSFGKAVLDSLVNYEYFSASLRTLMHQDVGAAKALEGQLVSLARNTPFSLVEIQDATKQLLAYGFAGGEVVGNIKMLGDVASGLKIPFSDIAYLYGTLKTQGRAYSKDINQFTGRGIPIVKELAKQFGVTDSQVMKLASDGKVGFKEVEKAFQSMTKEGGMFFNMMDTQSKTVGGQISALGDNWEQLKVNIGKSQTGIIASTTTMLNTLTGAFAGFFAQANQMEENFTRFGAQQLGYFEKQYMMLKSMITGSYKKGLDGDILTYDKTLQSVLLNSQESVSNAKNNIVQLFKQIAEEAGKFKSGEISQKEYNRRKASLAGTIEQVKGGISLASKKGEVSPLESATGATGKGGVKAIGGKDSSTGGTEIKGTKPQSIIINITKLVESLNINTTNLKESANRIKEEVSKALLEAVNDVNMVAR